MEASHRLDALVPRAEGQMAEDAPTVLLGGDLRPPARLTVTGADGRQAVLSWAEVDPDFSRHPVLLATRANGRPLDHEGPQLVVPHDRCGSRYTSAVTRIWAGMHLADSGDGRAAVVL